MDPCGAFVDLIRRPYTTKCRFFRDSDLEVDISWYPCKPDAPAIDTPTVISSLDWWVQERELGVWSGFPVGEVPDRPRKFNGLKVKPQANGLHRCGTEDEWANGAAFDPLVSRPKRADGLPTCCGGGKKGVVVGGTYKVPPRKLGIEVGGTYTVQQTLVTSSCRDGPIFLVPPNGLVTWVRPDPLGSPYTTFVIWVQIGVHGLSTRGRYLGARPGGTVVLRRITTSAPCEIGEDLYTGPSDVPFDFECPALPAPHSAYYILVDTTPAEVGSLLVISDSYTP